MTGHHLLPRCERIATSTWSEALDELAIKGVVTGLSQRSGTARFAGYAVTAREVAGPLQAFARREFAVGSRIASVGPGQVLVVDAGGAQVSTFGGLATLATSLRGAAAVVIDGGCRDIDEIRATNLWLASRFVTPISGKTRIRVESIGDPVHLGDVLVRAGDLVVGDATGIVIVPSAQIAAILAKAEAIVEKDRMIDAALRAGKSFSEAATAADYICGGLFQNHTVVPKCVSTPDTAATDKTAANRLAVSRHRPRPFAPGTAAGEEFGPAGSERSRDQDIPRQRIKKAIRTSASWPEPLTNTWRGIIRNHEIPNREDRQGYSVLVEST